MRTQTYLNFRRGRQNVLVRQAIGKARAAAQAIRHRRRYRKAICSPSQTYKRPADVLMDRLMTSPDKRQILLSWRSEAFLLQAAEHEGFGGGENCLADEIEDCLNQIKI